MKKNFLFLLFFFLGIFLFGCSEPSNNSEPSRLVISSSNTEPTLSELVFYDIVIENKNSSINMPVEINVNIDLNPSFIYYFLEGPFHIKLEESEYYSIVGQKEKIIDDFNIEKYFYNKKENPINITFTILPLKYNYKAESLNIKLKFQVDKEELSNNFLLGEENMLFVNLSEEYFYTIEAINYVINSTGIHFSGASSLDSFEDSKINLFYNCLNDEYERKIISKDMYMNYVIEFSTGNKVYILIANLDGILYKSKNIRAIFYLPDEYFYLFEYKINDEYELIAKELIKILYEARQIDLKTYTDELQYISHNKVTKRIKDIRYDLIPFEIYSDSNHFHYTIRK